MQGYFHYLQSSAQELAQSASLPIFVATFAGVSIACFAVGALYILRKAPLQTTVKPAQTAARGFGKLASSV